MIAKVFISLDRSNVFCFSLKSGTKHCLKQFNWYICSGIECISILVPKPPDYGQ